MKLNSILFLFFLSACGTQDKSSSTVSEGKDPVVVPVFKIAFGSCSNQDKPQPVLSTVVQNDPDVFIYLGDNIYGDTENMDTLRAKYRRLENKKEFQQLRDSCQVIAIWDDHDFGVNDGGKEYPKKEESKKIFLDFWKEPLESTRRKHKGIYTSNSFTVQGLKINIILPDNRTFRDKPEMRLDKKSGNDEYYPTTDTTKTFLGEEQWKWIEEELKKPADFRIIATSTQFVSEGNGYEVWGNFPHEKKRLQNIIEQHKISGVFFLSGDLHYAEISKMERTGSYPFYDITSSGITQTWHTVAPNRYREGKAFQDNNFGLLTFRKNANKWEVLVEIRNIKNVVVISRVIPLSEISF